DQLVAVAHLADDKGLQDTMAADAIGKGRDFVLVEHLARLERALLDGAQGDLAPGSARGRVLPQQRFQPPAQPRLLLAVHEGPSSSCLPEPAGSYPGRSTRNNPASCPGRSEGIDQPARSDPPAMSRPGDSQPRLSRASAGRLSLYLRRLEALERERAA